MEERRRIPLKVAVADPHTCTPEVRRRALSEVPFFSGLSPEELRFVEDRSHAEGFQVDQPIYHAGFEATRLFVVATGVVKTTRLSLDGRETLTDVLGSGEFFGALPAVGLDRYPDSAWALSPVCLLTFGVADFAAILDRFPLVARGALEAVARRLSDTQAALHRSGATVEARVASALLALALKLGEDWRDGVLLQVPLSRDDLAAMTGARTETVSRVLSNWRRQGVVDSGRQWVAIRDETRLAEIADR